jgi:hypothetical protein
MTDNMRPEDNVWYRQFYVWMIIFLPACAVAASFATLYIAARNPPEMAVTDYTSIEAIAAEQTARDQRARELGISAQIEFSGETVAAKVISNELADLPPVLTLRVQHSTTAEFDRRTNLASDGSVYTGSIALPSGAYDLHLEDPKRTWRLSARVSGRPDTIALEAFRQDR